MKSATTKETRESILQWIVKNPVKEEICDVECDHNEVHCTNCHDDYDCDCFFRGE